MIRISSSILYKKFNQTCTKRQMPNCRVRNRLNVLREGGGFIEKTVKIEKISIVTILCLCLKFGQNDKKNFLASTFYRFDAICELLSKFHICLRSFAYWANLYFVDNLSATSRYRPIYQQARKVFSIF